MANEEKKDDGLDTWVKADGKTTIKLNREKATVAKAAELGWTKK